MRPAGLEPATHSLEGCCSIHLSYGRVPLFNNLEDSASTATRFLRSAMSARSDSAGLERRNLERRSSYYLAKSKGGLDSRSFIKDTRSNSP
jgi:hypothetical protein